MGKDHSLNEHSKSVQSIQLEIIQNGPIIGILRLTNSEILLFSQWHNKSKKDIFSSDRSLYVSESKDRLHAITLIGWGIDNETKNFYWKILNSFGENWGNNGTGNIPFGFGSVEHEWYSVFSSPRACNVSEEVCLLHPPVDTIISIDDEIFLTEYKRTIEKTNSKKGSAMNDGSILGITILIMMLLSVMICNIHNSRKKRRLTTIDAF
jgi:hypothetical protein